MRPESDPLVRKPAIWNTLFAVFLLLAGLVFVALVANLASMHASDPMGRGMSYAFGVFLSIGLWVLLAGMLVAARTKGVFPSFSGWAVLLLLPASLAAMLATHSLFKSTLSPRWSIIPAAVPPLLLGFFAVALWFPVLRSRIQSFGLNCIVWGSVLLLSALPWVHLAKQSREIAAYGEGVKMQQVAEEQTRRERFGLLTSNSPLADWLEFAMPGDEMREEALARIRQLPRLQPEAEALLANGNGVILELLPALGLEMTPSLAQHARKVLLEFVQSFPGPQENPNSLAISAHRLERYTPALEWLCRHRAGDVAAVLDSIDAFARRHPDSAERTRLLGEVERLRHLSK
jgi:hypothetical protein